jgi:disulfide bond formation protein DsbB
MYPLAALAVVAAVRRDRSILRYLAALSAAGFLGSAYHIGIQRFPDQSTFCDVANPCSSRWVEAFDWTTIPTMAALSFALIFALAGHSNRK